MENSNNETTSSKKRWYHRKGCMVSLVLIGIIAFGLASPFLLRAYTALRFRGDTYTIEKVPSRPIAIVFGARVLRNGRLSTMLRDRVSTAADLYHAGKIDQILMTGDNREEDYNEPEAMRQHAIQLGVPDEVIILDPLGIRTYDSCYRAYHLFDIEEAILVTQNFHLDRALLLCDAMGMDVVGVWADYHRPTGQYGGRSARWSKWREIGATTLAFIDLIRRPDPILIPTP